jgi:eukaryotic-like serine/threonine-protein kinase
LSENVEVAPFHAVALIGLARANARDGNVPAALEAYQHFLAAWSDADADVPVLLEARAEFSELVTCGVASASTSY